MEDGLKVLMGNEVLSPKQPIEQVGFVFVVLSALKAVSCIIMPQKGLTIGRWLLKAIGTIFCCYGLKSCNLLKGLDDLKRAIIFQSLVRLNPGNGLIFMLCSEAHKG